MKKNLRFLSLLLCVILVIGLIPLTAFADSHLITSADISITKPLGGENPDFYPVSADSEKYYAEVFSWGWMYAGSVTPMGGGSEFKALERYDLRVIFHAKAGYRFSDNCVFTINGEKTGCFSPDSSAFRYTYLYAADPLCPTYTVSFDADGGTGTMENVSDVFDTYYLPWCTFTAPEGKFFNGWWVNGYLLDPGDTIHVLKNTTLSAGWKTIPAAGQGYSVTFDANGGTGAIDGETDFYGTFTLPECSYTAPIGKRFIGWMVNGDGVVRSAGSSIIISTNTSVAAIWEEITNEDNLLIFLDIPVEEPVAGATSISGSFFSTDFYEVSIGWSATQDGSTFNDFNNKPFEAGKTYYADLYLISKDPYIFDEETIIAVNGNSYSAQWTIGAEYKQYVAVYDVPFTVPAPKNGWVKENDKWYFYENGNMVTNRWKKDSIGWCYLGADGAMKTNAWVKDSIGWCYVGTDGYCVTSQWKQDSTGKWCYLNANGNMVINNWVKDGGKWYFLDANGYMVSNAWRKDSKGWCYLGADGAMKTNAWVKDSIGWCYVGADGYCVTSKWMQDSTKKWCYLNSNGNMVVNNWVSDGGKWYFIDADGYMISNTTKYWNGKTYYFNASGVCTNP